MGVYRNAGGLFSGMIAGYSQTSQKKGGITAYQQAQLQNKDEDQARQLAKDLEAQADDLREKIKTMDPSNYREVLGELVDFNARWQDQTPVDLNIGTVAANLGVDLEALNRELHASNQLTGGPEAAASTTQARPSEKEASPQQGQDPRFAAFNALVGAIDPRTAFGSIKAKESYLQSAEAIDATQRERIKRQILGGIPEVAKKMADQYAKEAAKRLGKDPRSVSWVDVIQDDTAYSVYRASLVQSIVERGGGAVTPEEVDEQLSYLDTMHKGLMEGLDHDKAEARAAEELMNKRAKSVDSTLLRWFGISAPDPSALDIGGVLSGDDLNMFREMSVRGRELITQGMDAQTAIMQLWDEYADRVLGDDGQPILTGLRNYDKLVVPQATTIPKDFRDAWPMIMSHPAVGGLYHYDRKTDTIQWLDAGTRLPAAMDRAEARKIAEKLDAGKRAREQKVRKEGEKQAEREKAKEPSSTTPTWDSLLEKIRNGIIHDGKKPTKKSDKVKRKRGAAPGPASLLFGRGGI